jgi:hypothetical protein
MHRNDVSRVPHLRHRAAFCPPPSPHVLSCRDAIGRPHCAPTLIARLVAGLPESLGQCSLVGQSRIYQAPTSRALLPPGLRREYEYAEKDFHHGHDSHTVLRAFAQSHIGRRNSRTLRTQTGPRCPSHIMITISATPTVNMRISQGKRATLAYWMRARAKSC